MGIRLISINVLSLFVLLQAGVNGSDPRAYLYYENAECNDGDITGTYVISFDNENFSGYGFSDSYSGACMYLTNGYWEVDMSYYSEAYESIEYGICVTCNGQIGCSSDGTCDNFMSVVPQVSYQMAQDDDQSEVEIADGAYELAAQMQQSTINALEANRTSGSSAQYIMIGAFIGCITLAGLLVTLEGLRILRHSKSRKLMLTHCP